MKKIITLCLFAFAMLIGTQSATAQSNLVKVNAEASEKTEALRKHIKFDTEQRDQVYIAIQEFTKVKMSAKKDEASIKKAENTLETKMKAILNEEQYERYKTFSEQ